MITSITYSDEAAELIALYESLPATVRNPNYWSSEDIDEVRLEIKKFYIQAQDYRCAYCGQRNLTQHGAVWDVEHVIAKSIRPDFMFHPENLAVSCKDCNIAKKESEVRVNPDRKTFPNRSEAYKIAHPHFDELDDHIGWSDTICYALTEKGAETIYMCKLYRFTVKKLGGGPGRLGDPFFANLFSQLNSSTTNLEAKAMLAALERYLVDE